MRREPSDARHAPQALAGAVVPVAGGHARRAARVLTLLALDFAGLAAAIFTALVLKAAVLSEVSAHGAYEETREHPGVRLPADGAAVRALGPVRGAGAAAGDGADRGVPLPGDVRGADLRAGERRALLQLLHLLGLAGVCAAVHPLLRLLYERSTGAILRAAGYERRAVLVGTGEHIREVAHALLDAPHSRIEVVGFVSPKALPANGLRSLGALRDLDAGAERRAHRRGDHRRPRLPQEDAVELVDRCHQRGVRVRIAPSTMEILIHRAEFVPGESVPLFELKPPVFEGIDFALKRAFDVVGATLLLIVLSPLLAAIMGGGAVDLEGPGAVPLDPPGDRRAAVRVPEVPHDVRGLRAPPGRPGTAQRGVGRAVQDPRRPPHDARWGACCGASRWTSCRSW